MDTIDLFLTSLRYTPIALMCVGLLMLLRIQLKEMRRS